MSDWNRVLIFRRLRWPALLLLTGVIALLDQLGILTWDHAWPLYLILLGIMALAERAAMASLPPYGAPYAPYPGYPSADPATAAYAAGSGPSSSAPAWTQNAAQPSPGEPGIVPVNPLTALAASPTPIDAHSSRQAHGFPEDDPGKES